MSKRIYGKRKIIDTAGKTKLISLPESFIEDYGLKNTEKVTLILDTETNKIELEKVKKDD